MQSSDGHQELVEASYVPIDHRSSVPRPQSGPAQNAAPNDKSVELRKVLGLIVTRLGDRPKPPSVFDQISSEGSSRHLNKVDAVVKSFRDVIRKNSSPPQRLERSTTIEEQENDHPAGFSTIATLELIVQLRDTLYMARKHGWEIMPTQHSEHHLGRGKRSSSGLSLAFKRRRSFGKASRSQAKDSSQSRMDLRSNCISLLAEIIEDDCRYQVVSPGLFTPPNALQAVCLDVALALLETDPEARTLADVAAAVVPSFDTFDARMFPRLLAFFEDGIIRRMLEQLARIRGTQVETIHAPSAAYSTSAQTPSVSINVAHVDDYTSTKNSPDTDMTSPGVVSSFAPHQALNIYRLSYVIPSILGQILDKVEMHKVSPETRHRTHRLLKLLFDAKPDAYLDLLQIVAYHSPKARLAALSVLSCYWPDVFGHSTVSRPLSSYMTDESQPAAAVSQLQHQFVPWRYPNAKRRRQGTILSQSRDSSAYLESCQACGKELNGFGLLCVLCPCSVHFNCYDSPDGSFLSQYPSASDPDVQRVAVTRFSRILPLRRNEPTSNISRRSGHFFHPINLFTLTTCLACQMPLWGCVAQGVQCSRCRRFAHTSCVTDELEACTSFTPTCETITIDWDILRKSFVEFHRDLLLEETQIMQLSYEDVSIIYGALWTQLQLMMNGVASGSIIVKQGSPSTPKGNRDGVQEFELQYCMHVLENYLRSGRNPKSHGVQEHERSQRSATDDSILYDRSLLVYLVASARAAIPDSQQASSAQNLSVDKSLDFEHAPEVISLGIIRSVLGSELNIGCDAAARHLLVHMHSVGLFRRLDRGPVLLGHSTSNYSRVLCSFPVPVLLDASVDVEALVSAIESCLDEINLTVNETALYLVTHRCWPTIWASEYGLDRLAQALLKWICSEDERLIIVAREHVALRRPVPGVLTSNDPLIWPSVQNDQHVLHNNAQSGSGYVGARKILLGRLAIPWMQALHHLDREAYAKMLFNYCCQAAIEKLGIKDDIFSRESDIPQATRAQWGDDVIRLVLRVCQSSVVFSSFDSIFVNWLDAASGVTTSMAITGYPSLPRLFAVDSDEPQLSKTLDSMHGSEIEPSSIWNVNPWKVITDTASSGQDGLRRSLKWLLVLAQSSVSIPASTYSQMAAFTRDFNADFGTHVRLMECITAACCLRPHGAQDLLGLITALHERLREWIVTSLSQNEALVAINQFVRLSLASCLLLVGFERDFVVSVKLMDEEESKRMPMNKRRAANRSAEESSNLVFNVDIIPILAFYVAVAPDQLCVTIAAFLNAIISSSSPLGPSKSDQFISLNAHAMATCAWYFYGVKATFMSTLRAPFLLRLLMVDPAPLEAMIRHDLKSEHSSGDRLAAVHQLTTICLEVNSPHFQSEERPWRPSAVLILNIFFELLWSDNEEDARQAAETASHTFTTAHRDVIARCWGEYLVQGPRPEQIRLLSFLLRLHPFFPTWRLVDWSSIVESMLEDDYVSFQVDEGDQDVLAHMMSSHIHEQPISQEGDASLLRVLLVSLSLQFIGDGVQIDVYPALKIKHHLSKVLGFINSRLVPTTNETQSVQFDGVSPTTSMSQPCVSALLRAVDCPITLELRPSAMGVFPEADTPVTCLVGGIFADLILTVLNSLDLSKSPYLMARAWLEMLIILILKYDIETPVLKHLVPSVIDAVRRTTDLLQRDVPDDLRHLALSVAHAFLHARPSMCAKILSRQIVAIISIISDPELVNDNVLVSQGKGFLETAFQRFASAGLFKSLFKKETLSPQIFDMLHNVLGPSTEVSGEEPIKNIVIRSVLSRMFESRGDERDNTQYENVQHIMNNLGMFVEKVYHRDYPAYLMNEVALALTNVTRRTAEWPQDAFNPDALLITACLLIQYNKALSRDLLLHTGTLLEASLQRFNISYPTLTRLARVSNSSLKNGATGDPDAASNHLAVIMVDALQEEMRGRNKATPSTLAALLDCVVACSGGDSPVISIEALHKVAIHAFVFLEATRPHGRYGPLPSAPNNSAAKLVLQACALDKTLINRYIGPASGRTNVPLKVWGALAVAALEVPEHSSTVLAQLPSFSLSFTTTMQTLSDQLVARNLPFSAVADVSYAYAGIKLWLILARRSIRKESTDEFPSDSFGQSIDEDSEQRRLWNEIWPPFERVLVASTVSADEASAPFLTMIWASYVDLIMFLLTSGSIIALDYAVAHTVTLQRLCGGAQSQGSIQKFVRALHSLQHPPPLVPFEIHIERVKLDFSAAEKLANTAQLQDTAVPDRRAQGFDRRPGDRAVKNVHTFSRTYTFD